jgi:serine protease Do
MMKKLIATLVLILAGSCVVFGSSGSPEVFGFSSEDMFSGSYLGVDTRDISADRLGALHLKEEAGVEVTLVDQDAPAGKAGIKEHDVILSINGNKVESVEQLRRMIREVAPGRTVAVGISRNGQPITLKALLADRKHSFAMGPNNFHFEVPAVPAVPAIPAIPAIPEIAEWDAPVSVVVVHSSARSGLMVENLTPQLGDFLGVKDGQGVLVRSVEKGSRAERAGFRAGDVVVKVNGEAVHDSGDFSHALRGRTKDTVPVNIIRDKKGQTLTLTLPERKQTGSIEETKSSSDEDAEIIDVQAMNIELAKIKPQVELAIERVKPEIAKVQVEMRKQAREIRKQVEEIKKEMRSNLGDI